MNKNQLKLHLLTVRHSSLNRKNPYLFKIDNILYESKKLKK